MSLRICLVSSEVAPFAKTGGLADVVAGLGRWLAGQGHDVRIFMPFYGRAADTDPEMAFAEDIGRVSIRFDGSVQDVGFRVGLLPDSAARIYFVDCPAMFGRDDIYSSYGDEHVRFALLCRATIEACQRLDWGPDVFHCNDWHTGLLPLYLRRVYGWDELFHGSKTLLTIHNIGYQGTFPERVLDDVGLSNERERFHQDDLEQKGEVNFLKAGVMYADWITTVSETYAWEIRTPDGGLGLEQVLEVRSDALSGIVNGVDYGTWDPAVDPAIPQRYSVDDLSGKLECKRRLLERMKLRQDDGALTIGIVSRLTAQKGFDLLPDALPVVLRDDRVRLVVLGSGASKYEDYFQWLRDQTPDRVGIYRGYNEELAHWIEAGADTFLMPSAFEPCGLNQMYSLRYGTPPIVRRTGGLADTVWPWNPSTGEGTGFVFEDYESQALLGALERTRAAWDDPHAWRRLMANGMRQDFSWDRQGPRYVELYHRILG